jgi:hypothetical protein
VRAKYKLGVSKKEVVEGVFDPKLLEMTRNQTNTYEQLIAPTADVTCKAQGYSNRAQLRGK